MWKLDNKSIPLLRRLLSVLNEGTSESRSEIPGKFLNVVLEKNGEDQLDRSFEK
jgi:hypothetical protein